SRRRHTRSKRDWSSDVCSSDLHIYPRKEYPELAFVDWNLLPLTHKKHNTFHDRENDEIIGEGLYWQRKRQKEFERWKRDRESPQIGRASCRERGESTEGERVMK